jgi:hypothetical protein
MPEVGPEPTLCCHNGILNPTHIRSPFGSIGSPAGEGGSQTAHEVIYSSIISWRHLPQIESTWRYRHRWESQSYMLLMRHTTQGIDHVSISPTRGYLPFPEDAPGEVSVNNCLHFWPWCAGRTRQDVTQSSRPLACIGVSGIMAKTETYCPRRAWQWTQTSRPSDVQ